MDGPRPDDPVERVLFGSSFEGGTFKIAMLSSQAFDRGGSAGIYKARTLEGEPRVVAVKVFGMLGPAQNELLARELRAASQVSGRHPRILSFLGTVAVGDQRALVSLYMGNGNLMEYLKAHRGCDKKRFILQIAEAINYLHTDAGLVHGDIKCANVLISDHEDALLADFGLSTFCERNADALSTSTAIRNMNTARFAAPELLIGADPKGRPRAKTRESDVYAFGMLILEALTENQPWYGLNNLAFILRVSSGEHPPRPSNGPVLSITQSAWDLCRSCWRVEPAERPKSTTLLQSLMAMNIEPVMVLKGHDKGVRSVAYMPGGDRIVSGSSDRSVRIWDACSGRCIVGPLLGHEGAVWCSAPSPDGLQIASCGYDDTIRRWDAQSGAAMGYPETDGKLSLPCIAYSPDGTRIVSGAHDGTIQLWHTATGAVLGDALGTHDDGVCGVAFSPDGENVASASYDKTICLWETATGVRLGSMTGHEKPIRSISFSPDGRRLVSGSEDRTVRIWDISKLDLENTLVGHLGTIQSVAWSPCGRYIASASDDRTVRIWDAQAGELSGELAGHGGGVSSVSFSPDSKSLASGSIDGTVRIWYLLE